MTTNKLVNHYDTCVSSGAIWLDFVNPKWYCKIDQDHLAMDTCDQCIMGQLYGDYEEGFKKFCVHLPYGFFFSAASLGFTLSRDDQATPCALVNFKELADAWRRAIRQRIERDRTNDK